MAWDLNRVTLIGRISNEPELKYIPSGSAVVKFGIAVGDKESVSFFNVVAWGKCAESISTYQHKGNQIAIDGRLEQRSWTAQDGTKRSTVEVIAERVEFLGVKKGQIEPDVLDQSTNDNFYDNTSFDPTPVVPNE